MLINYKVPKVIKSVKYFLNIFLILFLSSCGYHHGSIAHPQIKTIAFAPIINETYLPNASEYMRQALSEAFQKDGSWKGVSIEKADCILYGRVVNVATSAPDITITAGSINYMTNQFGITVTLEFTVIIPGRPTPLVPTTQVTGYVQYQVPVDYFSAQQEALQSACYQAAMNAVYATTEAW